MPPKTTSFYSATATCFGRIDHQRSIKIVFKKLGKNATHFFSLCEIPKVYNVCYNVKSYILIVQGC